MLANCGKIAEGADDCLGGIPGQRIEQGSELGLAAGPRPGAKRTAVWRTRSTRGEDSVALLLAYRVAQQAAQKADIGAKVRPCRRGVRSSSMLADQKRG